MCAVCVVDGLCGVIAWGKLEVRGQGIVEVPAVKFARLMLVVDLVDRADLIERLPEPEGVEILGHRVPSMKINAFEASAPLKVLLALQGHAGDVI